MWGCGARGESGAKVIMVSNNVGACGRGPIDTKDDLSEPNTGTHEIFEMA